MPAAARKLCAMSLLIRDSLPTDVPEIAAIYGHAVLHGNASFELDAPDATEIARRMVCEWGMSEKLGTMTYDERSENSQYLGGGGFHEKKYSEATAKAIDEEVRKILIKIIYLYIRQ